MVAFELKLTKNATADKEGAGLPLPRIGVERIIQTEPRRFNVLSGDIVALCQIGACFGLAVLASHGRAIKPHSDECRERIRTMIERTLTGRARMNAYKDRIAERERVKERKRVRVERGAGVVPVEPGSEEHMDNRHAVVFGEDENQRDENRMKDIHIGKKRGSKTANEEQPDKLRRTVRFEQEAPKNIIVFNHTRLLSILRLVKEKVGRSPYLCKTQVMWMMAYTFLRWMYDMTWNDERVVTSKKCWSGIEKMPEISLGEFNELVESMTCLNAFEGTSWTSWTSNQNNVADEKSNQDVITDEKSWKSNENIVMDEELVKNSVMNEEFVKNSLMDARLDPKVVMDLSIFKIVDGTICSAATNIFLGELVDDRNSKQRSIPQ